MDALAWSEAEGRPEWVPHRLIAHREDLPGRPIRWYVAQASHDVHHAAAILGDGGREGPVTVFLYTVVPPAEIEGGSALTIHARPQRFPTLGEIHSVLGAVALPGTLFQLPSFEAGAEFSHDPDEMGGVATIYMQVGAAADSPAARRAMLTGNLTNPGGLHVQA